MGHLNLSFSDWQSISLCNQQDYHNLPFAISKSHSHENGHADHTIITVLVEFGEAMHEFIDNGLIKAALLEMGVKYYGCCCLRQLYKGSMHIIIPTMDIYTHLDTHPPIWCTRLAFCKIPVTSLHTCASVILKLITVLLCIKNVM